MVGYVAPLVAHVAALMSHVATLVAHVPSLATPRLASLYLALPCFLVPHRTNHGSMAIDIINSGSE